MKLTLTRGRISIVIALMSLLAACGGGGGGDAGPSPDQNATPPSSGTYAWLLKAQGATDALKYGLSLLHPSAPSTEFTIESGSSFVTDAKLALRGNVDANRRVAESLTGNALLYIVGGDVRSVPLDANGTAPAARVQRAQSTSACSFAIDAQDLAAPQNSRFIVSTAGADGQCGTADDGRAELRYGPVGALTFTPISGAAPLGVWRDATSLAPRGWIFPKSLSVWEPAGASAVSFRTNVDAALTSVVASTYRDALVDDGNQLSLLDLSVAATPVETRLGAATTGGAGWVSIGFDANAYYAYRNSGANPNQTWEVLRVNRTTPSATMLASGSGQISVASMGTALLYATVFGSPDNRLLAISKTAGAALQTLETTPTTTLSTVQTSANSVHQRWRIQNIGSASVTYTVSMIDETGAVLYGTSSGGFPMAMADATTQNFNSSESRTRFVFANGYGSRAFGDATLVAYDTELQTATTFGALPGATDYGSDFVFASTAGGLGSFMVGFAARSSSGVVQASNAKAFSFDTTRPDSLRYANRQQ